MNPKNYAFNLTGRMRSGLTIDTAKSRLPVLAQRLTAIQPQDSEGARELQIQTPSRFSLSTQPEDDGPITSDRDFAHGDGRSGLAHRLLKPRQHVTRPRDRALERDRGSARRRCIALADRSAIALRRVVARALRRRRRPCSQHLVQRSPGPAVPSLARFNQFFASS